VLYGQIRNLRTRLDLIRWMQVAGIASLLLCVLSMFLIYVRSLLAAEVVFGVGLVLMIVSLALSLWEIQISVDALNLHLRDIERHEPGAPRAVAPPGGLQAGRTGISTRLTGEAASHAGSLPRSFPVRRSTWPNERTPVGQPCTQAEQRTHSGSSMAGPCWRKP